MPACPCCGSATLERRPLPAAHFACGACGHAWRPAAATDYAALAGRTVARPADLARRLAERLDFIGALAPGTRVVEVGCAEGLLGAALRRRESTLHLTGIEPSADAAAARAHFDVVHAAPLGPGLLAPAAAGCVLAFHVLEHLADPGAALGLIAAALAPDGRLIVEVPNGSGHPLLPFDANREHLQFYSAASLACQLARAGLETTRLAGGGFESPLYADCLRAEARPALTAAARTAAARARWRACVAPGAVIWGAGGDFETYVRPWLGALAPACIVDSSTERQGRSIDGIAVRAPAALAALPGAAVLVASYRYEAEILAALERLGIERRRIVTLTEVYAAPPSAAGGAPHRELRVSP